MKTVPEILALINLKISEHKKEIEMANSEIEDMKKKSKPGIDSAMKQLILKDKVMFHSAAALALNDLRESINA